MPWIAALFLPALSIALLCPAAYGVPINYGSHAGSTVAFIDVTEDSTTGDSVPLFGPPVFSGNSIDFNPVGFDAATSGIGGSDDTGARLTFVLESFAGTALTHLALQEVGDATLSGSGTDLTSSQVTASGTVTISGVDGAAITPIVRPIALTFTPSGGTYGLTSDGGGLSLYHTQWTGSVNIDVGQILTSEAVPFSLGATTIAVDLVNTLTATSEAGTAAVIHKKDFGVTINVAVPEPATLALAAAGLFAWGAARSALRMRG